MCSMFDPPRWLGFDHDGIVSTDFDNYLLARRSGDDRTAPTSQILAAHQSWLTLGLIEFVTRSRVLEADLLDKDARGDGRILCLEKLPSVLQRCDDLPTLLGGALPTHHRHIGAALDKALYSIHTLIRKIHNDPSGWPDHAPATLYSICFVCEAVTVAKNCIGLRSGLLYPNGPGPRSWNFILLLFRDQVEAIARSNGWCSSTISFLLDETTLSGATYAIRQKSLNLGDHTSCSSSRCEASNVDPDNYVAKHVNEECDCPYIHPRCDEVSARINVGRIPILSLGQSITGQTPSLDLATTDDVGYVCFSHVWADGLGSNTESGLPSCQVSRLSNLAGGSFWIDSLCIPKERGPRKKAIKMMAKIYQAATKVLVLDSSIQECLSDVVPEQRLLCVLGSGWMRRLWTLQEAILAAELVFRFKDSSISIQNLLPNMASLHQNPLLASLSSGVERLVRKRNAQVESGFARRQVGFTLADVSRAVRWRTTSRTSDETLAIASLLDLEAGLLLETKEEERVLKLLTLVGAVPLNILFLSGNKSTAFGYRWAPQTLMTCFGGLNLTPAETQAQVTSAGLLGTYDTYLLPTETLVFQADRWWVIADEDANQGIHVVDPYAQDSGGESYRCDVLILPGRLRPGQILAAVAAQFVGASKTDGVIHCVYQRRLIAVNRTIDQVPPSGPVIPSWVGRAKLCIT